MMVAHNILASLCQSAYNDVTGDSSSVNMNVFPGIECRMYRVGNNAIYAFRGTDELYDIIRDVRLFPVPGKTGWFPAGPYFAAKRWVDAYCGRLDLRRKIILTGHSLGAGVAAIAATLLGSVIVDEVVLFSEPSFFYFGSRKKYANCGLARITKSYMNDNDWIHNRPPGWMFGSKTCVPVTSIGFGGHAISDVVRNMDSRQNNVVNINATK